MVRNVSNMSLLCKSAAPLVFHILPQITYCRPAWP